MHGRREPNLGYKRVRVEKKEPYSLSSAGLREGVLMGRREEYTERRGAGNTVPVKLADNWGCIKKRLETRGN